MNVLHNLRKPYLSILMASLLLFTSCQNDVGFDGDLRGITLEKFVESHLQISDEMYRIIANEKEINKSLDNLTANKTIDFNSFQELYKKANIKEHDRLAELSMKIYNNAEQFVKSNPDFLKLPEEQRTFRIQEEIENQSYTLSNISDRFVNEGYCEDARDRGRRNCQIAYGIAMGATAVGCWFTLGVGCVIGALASQSLAIACESNVVAEYNDCIENQNNG